MRWTSLIGRQRPLELDALRLSTLIHQLGRTPVEPEADVVRRLDGEELLQILDHLLRHPTTLAYVLIDRFARGPELAEPRGTVARQVRRLLDLERRRNQPARRPRSWQNRPEASEGLTLHPFVPPRRQPLDDALAFLSSRDLVRVEVRHETPDDDAPAPYLSYALTAAAAELLESELYPKDRHTMLHLQLCGTIHELLPALDGPGWRDLLQDVEQELDEFRDEEQLAPEQDPLSVLFHHTFQERL